MKNIKIGTKLIVSSLLTAALMAFMGIYSMKSLTTLDGGTNLLHEKGAVPLEMLVKTAHLLQDTRLNVRRWQASKTDGERAASIKAIDDVYASIKELLKKQEELALGEANKKSLDDLDVSVDKYMAEVHSFVRTAKKFSLEGVNTDDFPPTFLNASKEMMNALDAVVEKTIGSTETLSDNATKLVVHTKSVTTIILIVALLFSTGFSIFLTYSITHPLKVVVDTLNGMEKGDMTVRANLKREDEFGLLSKALNSLSVKLHSIFEHLQNHSGTLASSAEELSAVGKQIANAAEASVSTGSTVASASEQAATSINSIASNAEKTSVNANEVASSAEQMSVNMNTIASATEEMSASISEISNNANEVNKISNEATVKSHNANEVMGKLGAAAKEIGQVTDVIKKIADKTNLLALNATIEAASAGPAGKGFAVVAGEIKELANQSALSADDIARRIESIQVGTNEAVNVIDDVSDIIAKINHSVKSISTHVGEQTKASNEIARNVAQANTGAKRVASSIAEVAKNSHSIAHNAGEAAKGAGNISQSVSSIAQDAKNGAQGAKQTKESADELARIANDLKHILSQFKV